MASATVITLSPHVKGFDNKHPVNSIGKEHQCCRPNRAIHDDDNLAVARVSTTKSMVVLYIKQYFI